MEFGFAGTLGNDFLLGAGGFDAFTMLTGLFAVVRVVREVSKSDLSAIRVVGTFGAGRPGTSSTACGTLLPWVFEAFLTCGGLAEASSEATDQVLFSCVWGVVLVNCLYFQDWFS